MRDIVNISDEIIKLQEQGYTQAEIAKAWGVSQSQISRWANGESKMTRRVWGKIKNNYIKFLNNNNNQLKLI